MFAFCLSFFKSDEAFCNYVEHCPSDRHACPDHSGCLPLERLCDGVHDCRDRSDEDRAVCDDRLKNKMVNLTSAAVRSPCEGRNQFRDDIQCCCELHFNVLLVRLRDNLFSLYIMRCLNMISCQKNRKGCSCAPQFTS